MRRTFRSARMGQNYGVVLNIPVRITQTAAGLVITAQVFITPQGMTSRGAHAGEATLTLWRQSVLGLWNIFSGPHATPEGGLIEFGAFNYGNDSYRLTAKHIASGAEVGQRFHITDNVVDSQDPVTVLNVGNPMPAGWS